MDILWWALLGLVAGAIARLLVPGRDNLGVLGTILLGVVGSVVGGFLGNVIQPGDQTGVNPAGLIGSIIGAIIALLVYRAFVGRRTARTGL